MEQRLKVVLACTFLLWYPLSTFGDDNVIPESDLSSLIFVFDVTGSMSPELQQVKNGALKILQELSQKEDKIIKDYIFVPFNDPEVGPAIKTTNATVFDEMLRKLTVDGGGDCPEMCLTGIKEGLALGLPKSFLFVFTDADPKDSELLPEILTAIAEKQTQVFFILTGYCTNTKLSQEYQRIASASNGLIIDTSKSNISEVLKYIHFKVNIRRVDVLAVDDNQSRIKKDVKFNVPVDETMNELVISLATKDDAVLKVTNPLGKVFTDSSFCNTFLEMKTSKMCSVQNPILGTWIILLESITSFSLRASATSKVAFDFGFEIFKQNQSSVTDRKLCQPVEGTENTFLLKLNDSSQIASLTSVEIISLEGQILSTFPLKPVKQEANLFYGSFVPTNSSYHLRINGETNSGFKFQRVTSVAFSSYSGNSQESINCTALKIDYVPENNLVNKSPTFSKQPWFAYLFVAMALMRNLIFVPDSQLIC